MSNPDPPSFLLDFPHDECDSDCGLVLGDITFTGTHGSASSAGWVPNQSMAWAPTLTEYLVEFARLLSPRFRGGVTICGPFSSSFCLDLHRRRDSVTLRFRDIELQSGAVAEWLMIVQRDLAAAAEVALAHLSASDPTRNDLSEALSQWAAVWSPTADRMRGRLSESN